MPVRPYSSYIAVAGLIAVTLLLGPGFMPRADAATREFYFDRIGRERGLAQNTVNALVQDTQGFVWVGTQGGLHRYDGQRYVLYRHDPRDPASLPDSYVTSLALEADRALWIGTYSQYVARLDLANGRIRRFMVDDRAGHASHQAMALLPQAGKLWVGTLAGLQRLDPDTGRRDTVVRLDPRRQREIQWQMLIEGRDGHAWYGSPIGLFRIDPRGGVERVGPIEPVRSLQLDHRGRLWVGRTDGLYRLHSDGASLLKAWPAVDAPAEAGGDVRAIVEAPDRHL